MKIEMMYRKEDGDWKHYMGRKDYYTYNEDLAILLSCVNVFNLRKAYNYGEAPYLLYHYKNSPKNDRGYSYHEVFKWDYNKNKIGKKIGELRVLKAFDKEAYENGVIEFR